MQIFNSWTHAYTRKGIEINRPKNLYDDVIPVIDDILTNGTQTLWHRWKKNVDCKGASKKLGKINLIWSHSKRMHFWADLRICVYACVGVYVCYNRNLHSRVCVYLRVNMCRYRTLVSEICPYRYLFMSVWIE